jgi:DNA-binding NtrC family response regulator
MDVGSSIDEVERETILKTLNAVNGSKTQAARILMIGLKTLYRKLEKYNTYAMEKEPGSTEN